MKKYICIDIGGTSIKYGKVLDDYTIIESGNMDTNASKDGGAGVVSKCKQIVENYLKNDKEIDGICISTAGIVDKIKGEIVYAYELFIPGYTGTKLKSIMEDTFNIKCEVENDVNCAGLCEANLGDGKGKNPVVCLTIGTGIGGCIIIDGKILGGVSHSAGEMGYFMLRDGKSFQDLASTTSLVRRMAEANGISTSEINGKKIFEMYENGDKDAIESIDDMSKYLANGLGVICCTLNPEMIILGGGVMARGDVFAPKIEAHMKEQIIPMMYKNTKITFATKKNDAGMLGALVNFKQLQA